MSTWWEEWIESKDSETRAEASRKLERLRALNIPDAVAENLTEAQFERDYPADAAATLYRRAWEIIDESVRSTRIEAIQRLSLGVGTPDDLRKALRFTSFITVLELLHMFDEGNDPLGEYQGRWRLMEADDQDDLTGRQLASLHDLIVLGRDEELQDLES